MNSLIYSFFAPVSVTIIPIPSIVPKARPLAAVTGTIIFSHKAMAVRRREEVRRNRGIINLNPEEPIYVLYHPFDELLQPSEQFLEID